MLRHQDRAALHDALTLLWQVPAAQAYALEAAWAQLDAPDVEALRLRMASEPDSLCAPWCEATQALLPRVEKEKPRRLLEDLAHRAGVEKQKDVLALAQTAALFDSMDEMLQALLLGEEGDIRRLAGAHYASGAVRLMTLHGSKGLEFPVVFLAGAARGELPLEREGRPTDLPEERRLFFVGMTRAKEELILTCGGEPSPFLSELPGEVEAVEIPAYKKDAAVEQLSLF